MTLSSTYRPKRGRLIVAALAIAVGGAGSLVLLHRTTPTGCTVASAGQSTYNLDPVQAQNASIIAAEGVRSGMPDHGVTVALAASLQETELRNLPYGDRDSLGLFQQRPSQGWGSPTQLMDPAYASSAFYRRLVGVAGWESMSVSEAAQRVQRSATPQAYAAWEPRARALAQALTGEVAAGMTCRFSAFQGAAPAPTALAAAATAQFGSRVIGVTLSSKLGWSVATWVLAHAYRYHVDAVSFGGRRWTRATGAWRPDPSAGNAVSIVTA